VKVELSVEHEPAQTVVSGRGVQEPLASQAWQAGQEETSQQKLLVQLPVVHWSLLVQLPIVCCATQVPPLQ
jgi:hypothetical protein